MGTWKRKAGRERSRNTRKMTGRTGDLYQQVQILLLLTLHWALSPLSCSIDPIGPEPWLQLCNEKSSAKIKPFQIHHVANYFLLQKKKIPLKLTERYTVLKPKPERLGNSLVLYWPLFWPRSGFSTCPHLNSLTVRTIHAFYLQSTLISQCPGPSVSVIHWSIHAQLPHCGDHLWLH